MKSIHRAWLVCIGCTLLLFCTIGLVSSAFSVYQPYLISDLGLTNAQASSVVTVRNLFALAAMLGVARYYRRLSLRTGAVLAVLGAAASFFLFGIARSFAGCCLSAAVAGTAYGFGGMPSSAPMLPPKMALRKRSRSGIRRTRLLVSLRFAFHLSIPNARNAATLMTTSQQVKRPRGVFKKGSRPLPAASPVRKFTIGKASSF